jgi:hypothetical protein
MPRLPLFTYAIALWPPLPYILAGTTGFFGAWYIRNQLEEIWRYNTYGTPTHPKFLIRLKMMEVEGMLPESGVPRKDYVPLNKK